MQPTFKEWLSRSSRIGPKPRTRLKRGGKVKQVSSKRMTEWRIYSKRRKRFLEDNPMCQAWPIIVRSNFAPRSFPHAWPQAEEVHHKLGRHGGNYLKTSTWLAVSRWAHRWIHACPAQARQLGLIG